MAEGTERSVVYIRRPRLTTGVGGMLRHDGGYIVEEIVCDGKPDKVLTEISKRGGVMDFSSGDAYPLHAVMFVEPHA